jgi:hypothetical protein
MLDLCRKEELDLRQVKDTVWRLERYRMAWYFDRYIKEQESEGISREKTVARFPDMGPQWAAWRNQTDQGTIQVPPGWCETCEGTGLIPCEKDGSRWTGKHSCPAMKACACRKVAA